MQDCKPCEITKLIYHDPPMVFIDRYVEVFDEGIICEVDINEDCLFFSKGEVPAFVGVEYMAQTIAVFAGLVNKTMGKSPDIGYLIGSRQVEFFCDSYKDGQTLQIRVERTWDGVTIVSFSCEIFDRKTKDKLSTATISVYSPHRTAEDAAASLSEKIV